MRHLALAVLLSSCKASPVPPPPAPEPPKDLGPLPDECRPWRPAAEAVELAADAGPIIEGSRDRQYCTQVGKAGPGEDPRHDGQIDCDVWSLLNSQHYAEAHLFPWTLDKDGSWYRVPCGSSVDCGEPYKADQVECEVKIGECEPPDAAADWLSATTKVVTIVCRGDRFCERDKARDCCRVTKRRKVRIEQSRWEVTPEDSARFDRERCERLKKRHETCEPYCTLEKYAGQCGPGWQYLGDVGECGRGGSE